MENFGVILEVFWWTFLKSVKKRNLNHVSIYVHELFALDTWRCKYGFIRKSVNNLETAAHFSAERSTKVWVSSIVCSIYVLHLPLVFQGHFGCSCLDISLCLWCVLMWRIEKIYIERVSLDVAFQPNAALSISAQCCTQRMCLLQSIVPLIWGMSCCHVYFRQWVTGWTYSETCP